MAPDGENKGGSGPDELMFESGHEFPFLLYPEQEGRGGTSGGRVCGLCTYSTGTAIPRRLSSSSRNQRFLI
jgi:hypothetical protein